MLGHEKADVISLEAKRGGRQFPEGAGKRPFPRFLVLPEPEPRRSAAPRRIQIQGEENFPEGVGIRITPVGHQAPFKLNMRQKIGRAVDVELALAIRGATRLLWGKPTELWDSGQWGASLLWVTVEGLSLGFALSTATLALPTLLAVGGVAGSYRFARKVLKDAGLNPDASRHLPREAWNQRRIFNK